VSRCTLLLFLAACGWPSGHEPDDGPDPDDLPQQPGLHPNLERTDAWPDGFAWDVARFPALAQIELGPNGLPVDPRYIPGPDRVPAAVLDLVGLPSEGPPTSDGPPAPAPPAPRVDRRDEPVGDGPPARLRCDVTRSPVCFHEVPAAEIWLMAMEVNLEWLGHCAAAAQCPLDPRVAARVDTGPATAPARGLSWREADAVCRFLGGRVPSEDEWALAARGAHPASCDPPCDAPTDVEDAPVDGVDGHQALSGGVAEWTSTLADEASPEGPLRVVRGGSWKTPSEPVRRTLVAVQARPDDVGVRCAWGSID
jgi:hypothetical protein